MGWTVRESNPYGGEWEGFSALVQTGPGAHPVSHTLGTQLFPEVKWSGYGVHHPGLNKDMSSTSNPLSEPSWPLLGRTLAFFKTVFRTFYGFEFLSLDRSV
jgi:hypothetical protein